MSCSEMKQKLHANVVHGRCSYLAVKRGNLTVTSGDRRASVCFVEGGPTGIRSYDFIVRPPSGPGTFTIVGRRKSFQPSSASFRQRSVTEMWKAGQAEQTSPASGRAGAGGDRPGTGQ